MADPTSATDRLELVLQIGHRVTSLLDPEVLLPEACRLIAEAFAYDTVGINLFDPLDGQRLYQGAAFPPSRALPGSFRLPITRGLTGWVARNGESRLVNDVSTEPLYVAGPGRNTRSELDVPLKVGDRTIGVLNVESDRVDAFSPDDVPYLQGLANFLAQAIENARLTARSRELAASEERSRIAKDLHDDTIQALVAIDRQLELLDLDLENREQARTRIAALGRFVGRTIDGVRRLSRNLQPALLEDLGLVAALRQHAADLEAAGLHVSFVVRGKQRRLAPAVESAVYRVAQEGLANVLRHAGISAAELRLEFSRTELDLEVVDHGAGFGDRREPKIGGQGLAGMRDRAAEIRGTISIDSIPAQGTRVHLRVPLEVTVVDRL